MKIVFHSNQLSLRGTEVALFDYAYFNQKILGNESVVVYDRNNDNNSDEVIQKFGQAFPTYGYNSFDEVDSIVKKHEAALLYCIKSGKRDGKVSKLVPTMVHAVFPTSISQMHGAAFAYVSEWLSSLCSNGKVPYVPHMVHLPSPAPDMPRDLRAELGIPPNATVFATYGGATSFDIRFVREGAIPAA